MALPTQRRTRAAQGRRRSQQHLKEINLIPCPNCHRRIRPHHICPFCGYYGGQLVREIKVKKNKPGAAKK